MAVKAKPYEQFGPYLLFKKLEADALGELWRAARIEGDHLGEFVAIRRLTGGHRTALLQSAAEAREVVPLLSGTSFVKHQVIDVHENVPFIVFDYAGGRSLRQIVDRARGGGGDKPNPIPLDQAVLIADRIALSLATTSDFRHGATRLSHGALIPQFIWITDDGEVRVAGQHLGKGIVASLGEVKVNAELGRYFSPEYHSSRESTKSSEIYSVGAILFLLVTGHEPPDPLSVTAFTQVIRAAKMMTGQPIPLEIRTILDKSLILDPASRFATMNDMKQALSAAAAKHSATTFNLAFYLSTLLKKELEAEALEREKESKVNLAPYLAAAEVPADTGRIAAPVITAPEERKSRAPLYAAAAIAAVAAIGTAAFMVMRKGPAPSPAVAAPVTTAPKPEPIAVSEPVLASTAPPGTTTATVDPNAHKKAFEAAVNRKLQEEMLKLQSNFERTLQQKKAENAPVAIAETRAPAEVAQPRPASAPVVEERAPSAAELDERRLAAARAQQAATQTVAPAVVQPQPAPQPAAVAEAPARVIQEGDVVEMSDLDTAPRPLRPPIVAYPPMALRQRAETSVIVTALVSENGDVIDVRVLRGDARFGFNDAAMRALRSVKFTPAVKNGKRVKTWWPQTVNFKL